MMTKRKTRKRRPRCKRKMLVLCLLKSHRNSLGYTDEAKAPVQNRDKTEGITTI
jgi:hypothetical protein